MYIEYGWTPARDEWRGVPTQSAGPIPSVVLGCCPPLVDVGAYTLDIVWILQHLAASVSRRLFPLLCGKNYGVPNQTTERREGEGEHFVCNFATVDIE